MNMQDFYQRLTVKPEQPQQHHVAHLTRASRTQILNATSELVWYVWNVEAEASDR